MRPFDPTRGGGNLTLTTRRAFLQVGYSGLLGLGLPSLLAARSAAASGTGPSSGRARSVLVILLSGGLIAGILADLLGVPWAIAAIAALTFIAGVVVLTRMYETLPARRHADVEHEIVDRGHPAAPAPGTAR